MLQWANNFNEECGTDLPRTIYIFRRVNKRWNYFSSNKPAKQKTASVKNPVWWVFPDLQSTNCYICTVVRNVVTKVVMLTDTVPAEKIPKLDMIWVMWSLPPPWRICNRRCLSVYLLATLRTMKQICMKFSGTWTEVYYNLAVKRLNSSIHQRM